MIAPSAVEAAATVFPKGLSTLGLVEQRRRKRGVVGAETANTSGKHLSGQSAASSRSGSWLPPSMFMTKGLDEGHGAWLCEPRYRCRWAGAGFVEE